MDAEYLRRQRDHLGSGDGQLYPARQHDPGNAIADGDIIQAIAVLSGTSIRFTARGELATFTSSFNQTVTKHGLSLGTLAGAGRGNVLADNFEVFTGTSYALVAFDGDSITRGLGTSLNHSFPFQVVEQLEQLGYGRCLRVNLGVDAQTIANMSTDAAATDAFYNGSLRRNVIVVFAGTNDLYFGATATDTYNALVSYCQARQTTGWEVVVVTMLPRSSAGTPAGFETARGTVNGNIRSNWRTFADAIADIAADGRIGDSGDELDTTYYNADKVHLVDAGHDVVTEHVRNAIMTLIATQ